MKKQQWRLKEMEGDGALCGSMELMQPKGGSPGRVKSWTILEDSRLSESCLAWARNDILRLADKTVAVGDLCEISDLASGMGPMLAKRVRTSLQKRGRCLFCRRHGRNLDHSVDMRNDVPIGCNPGNGLADIGNARYRGGLPQLSALNVVPAKVFLFRERVLPGMNEKLKNLNRSVVPGPGSLFQSGFAPNAAVEWVQGMEGTNMKADGVATTKSNSSKNFGPQRNFVHGRGKGKMFPEEQKPCLPPVGTRSKCNQKHDGGLCYGTTNHCFRCKETGHIKRHCPMSRQSMNALGTGRPQSIGRVVIMCGADASEADGLTRCRMYEEKGNESQRSYALIGVHRNHGDQGSHLPLEDFNPTYFLCAANVDGSMWEPFVLVREMVASTFDPSADKAVAVGDLCEISDQASGMGPVSAKRVRTSLHKRGRCLFCRRHGRNLDHSVDMCNDVPAGCNPGNGLADIGNARYRGGVPQLSTLNVVPAKVFLFRERQ
ncbi:hypothetical protein Lal_00024160 [Lupinus albus]|nr:hypothetical protein Lal_00024160 [Lupinus albus]